jgi:CRP-like cAMP-binding protein
LGTLRNAIDRIKTEEAIRELDIIIRCLRSDMLRSMFVVVSGALEVSHTNAEGQVERVGILGRGHGFGDLTNILGAPREATITCVADAVLAEYTRKDILMVLESNPRAKTDLEELTRWAEGSMLRANAFLKCEASPYDQEQV